MRILFIHNQYQQPGGEDVALALESALLEEHGHDVRSMIFQNSNPSGLLDRVNMAVKTIYNRSSYQLVLKELKSFRPDVVHVHNFFFEASPAVLFAAAKLKIPVVLTLHNYRLVCANALLLREGKVCELCIGHTIPLAGIRYKCYRNSVAGSAVVTAMASVHKILGTWNHKVTRFILLTEFAKDTLTNSSLNTASDKFLVKPNFIPDPGRGEIARENFFLFVGRISNEKGIDTLWHSFSEMPSENLVVIGEGPEMEKYKSRNSEAPNIQFTGKMSKEEVLNYMKRCRAVILPSKWYEGLPFVIIESFATGTPIIASRLGSMVELVEDGYNGFHFEAGNSSDLRAKIELLLRSNEGVRVRLNENARNTYLTKYHPQIHYQSILSIYENAITEK